MDLQKLKEFGRRLIAPEAMWRLDSRLTYASVPNLRVSLSLPLYEMSKEKRDLLGMFYASFPETAAFLIQRILHECMACNGYDKSKFELQAKQAYLVGVRLFGERGQSALSNAYGTLIEEDEAKAAASDEQVRILVHAGLFDVAVVRSLKDYEAALAAGKTLANIDQSMVAWSDDYLALIGKHWKMCGSLLVAFEPWLVLFRLNEAISNRAASV